MHGPQANQSGSMEQHPVRSVRLLCSVFELASGDLFSLARRRWRQGAPAGVVTRVMHDVGQALRCMHACGVAHGDLKMANVLKTGDSYKLADLPALTRSPPKAVICTSSLAAWRTCDARVTRFALDSKHKSPCMRST